MRRMRAQIPSFVILDGIDPVAGWPAFKVSLFGERFPELVAKVGETNQGGAGRHHQDSQPAEQARFHGAVLSLPGTGRGQAAAAFCHMAASAFSSSLVQIAT